MSHFIFLMIAVAALSFGCRDTSFQGEAPPVRAAQQVHQQPNVYPDGSPGDLPALPDTPDTLADPDLKEDGGPGIFDRIKDFFGNLNFDKLTWPNNIDFGGRGEVFHLGDDNFSGSSCKLLILMKPLSGKTFRFFFQVTEPNTEVEVDIQSICGIDYQVNQAAIIDMAGHTVDQTNLSPRQKRQKFQKRLLQPGNYEVRVVSPAYTMSNGQIDHDDFIVGRVRVSSDKPLIKGEVRAE